MTHNVTEEIIWLVSKSDLSRHEEGCVPDGPTEDDRIRPFSLSLCASPYFNSVVTRVSSWEAPTLLGGIVGIHT